jgi:predicted dehydrogenase
MNKIKAAVIGVGLLGSRHGYELKGDERVELVAVADLKKDLAQSIAGQLGCQAYSDYGEMLAKEAPDLVFVATPDPFHKDPVVACCEAGVKYVALQKPMATTVQDAEEMTAAAKESGTTIYMIFATRWSAANNATRHVIRQGLIGKPVYADLLTEDSITVPREMWGGKNQTWAHLSSSLHFLHSHLVDRVLWLYGPVKVESVYAVSQRELLGYTPDLFDSFLMLDNGLKVRVKTGWVHFIEGGVENRDIYNGTQGMIINNISPAYGVTAGWRVNVDDCVPIEDLLAAREALYRAGIGSRIMERQTCIQGWMRGIKRGLELETAGNAAPNPTKTIIDSIMEGTLTPSGWRAWQGDSPLPTVEDGLVQTKIVCAIEESAATGQVIRVEE